VPVPDRSAPRRLRRIGTNLQVHVEGVDTQTSFRTRERGTSLRYGTEYVARRRDRQPWILARVVRGVTEDWNTTPVVVTVAVTGADVFRDRNENIPYTTEEVANAAIEAAGAGATVAHLHVREDDGTPSGRPELFQDVIRRIRGASDILTMVSTGGANDMTIDERTTGLEAEPDLCGVESGSMNFGDETFMTPPAAARGIISRALKAGIGLEVEAFDVGHVVSAVRWLDEGILPPPLRINLVLGVRGGIDASPEALVAMLRPLPPEAFWTITCIGRHHPRMLALGLLHGASGIRTGLEDTIYLRRGVPAPSNAALVEAAVTLARAVGRKVATPEQARSLLALG
jgi:3-keto-5-aminohexanoate cleavage enzyme